MGERPKAIVFNRDRKSAVIPAAQEGRLVLFDFQPGNRYVASNGSWFEIKKDSKDVPSGRFDVVIYDKVNETKSREHKGKEELETLVKENEYVLESGAASVDGSAGEGSPDVSVDHPATGQVIDLAPERERRQEREEKTDDSMDETGPVTQAASKSKETAGAVMKGAGEVAPEGPAPRKRKGKGSGSGDGGDGKDPDDQKAGGVVPVAPEAAEEADIAWRKELDTFRERFEKATQAYRGMIGGEWKRFLEATFPFGKVFTEEKQVEIWKTELLPRIRKSIFEDIVRRGIDPEKAEEVISAMLRELDEERNRKIAETEAKRARKAEEKSTQASLNKQSTT